MKKLGVIVLIVLLLGAVGWAGTTYVIGSKAQHECARIAERYQHWGPMSFTVENYARGFFSSKARTVFTMQVPPPKEKAPQIEALKVVFDNTVHHGPFLPDGGTGLALIETRVVSISPPGGDAFEKFLAKYPQLKNPVVVTKIAFDGTDNIQANIPPVEDTFGGEHFRWHGLKAEGVIAPGAKSLTGSFAMPGMDLHGKDGDMSWAGASGRFDVNEALPQLYVGTSEAKIGSMNMQVDDSAGAEIVAFDMKGMDLTSVSSYKDGLVQARQSMAFAGVTADGKTYGPGALELEELNLAAEPLASFQQQVTELYRGQTTADPQALMGRMLPLYQQLFMKLAAGKPELNIRRLHFAMPQGDIDGSLLVSFADGPGLDLKNPLGLLQRLEAKADLAVTEQLVRFLVASRAEGDLKKARKDGSLPAYSDAKIAELAQMQTSQQIIAVLSQNLAVRDGDKIKTSARLHGGELTVNGQTQKLF